MNQPALKPQEGPQLDFLSTKADIAIYGGAAGGGKSWALLYEATRYINKVPNFGAVIFRRVGPQITNEGGLWDCSKEIFYGAGGRPRENSLDWLFKIKGYKKPNKIKMASMQYEKDKEQWQGSQIPFIGFDELTHFEESQFKYMFSRNRSTCGAKPYIRATTNPDANSWVRGWIDWFIDQDTGLAIQERSGKLRFFVVVNDVMHWASDPEELMDELGDEILEDDILSFTFINASITDNKILLEKDPSYMSKLKALSRIERERLLGGNWNITEEDGLVLREWWCFYEDLPPDLRSFTWSWDLAARDKTHNDYTVGGLWGENDSGYYLIKMVRFKAKYPKQKRTILEFYDESLADGYVIEEVLIEDKSNGTALIDEFKETTLLPIIGVTPKNDKVARVNACSPTIEAGNVYLQKGDGYTKIFVNEFSSFPSDGVNDDIVDMTSQYLNRRILKKQLGLSKKQKNELKHSKKTTEAPALDSVEW